MRTIDGRGAPSSSLVARVRRDASLLLRLAAQVIAYLTVGGRIRRRYRRAERRGHTYWLDDEPFSTGRR